MEIIPGRCGRRPGSSCDLDDASEVKEVRKPFIRKTNKFELTMIPIRVEVMRVLTESSLFQSYLCADVCETQACRTDLSVLNPPCRCMGSGAGLTPAEWIFGWVAGAKMSPFFPLSPLNIT